MSFWAQFHTCKDFKITGQNADLGEKNQGKSYSMCGIIYFLVSIVFHST